MTLQDFATRPALLLAAVCLAWGGPRALAQPPRQVREQSKKVVVMIVATSTVGGQEEDIKRVTEVIDKGVKQANTTPEGNQKKPGNQGFVKYDGPTVFRLDSTMDRAALLDEVGKLDVDKDTTLIFYYKGHAAVARNPAGVPNQVQGQPFTHFLFLDYTFPKYAVRRDRLLEALKQKGARLTVLLTECCSDSIADLPREFWQEGVGPGEGAFTDLFLLPRGVVDITSSRFGLDPLTGEVKGQASWSPTEGGLFTRAFHALLVQENAKKALDRNQDGVVSWEEFFEALKERTNKNYQAFRLQKWNHPDRLPVLSEREIVKLYQQLDQTPMAINKLPPAPQPAQRSSQGVKPKQSLAPNRFGGVSAISFGSILLSSSPQKPPPNVPPGFSQDPALFNAWTSDSRIQLRRFHAITVFDTKAHPRHGPVDKRQLQFVLGSFSNFLYRESIQQLSNIRRVPFVDVARKAFQLEGAQATWANLDAHLKQLEDSDPANEARVKDGDVVFCWIEAEGAKDKPDELVLWNGDRIKRTELRRRLEFPVDGKRRTHLTVFVTDACRDGVAPKSDKDAKEAERPKETAVWRALYFGHRGTIDISSAPRGKASFAARNRSLFMEAFSKTFDNSIVTKGELTDKEKLFVRWDTFFKKAAAMTQSLMDEELKDYFTFPPGKDPEPTAKLKERSEEDQTVLREMAKQREQKPDLKAYDYKNGKLVEVEASSLINPPSAGVSQGR